MKNARSLLLCCSCLAMLFAVGAATEPVPVAPVPVGGKVGACILPNGFCTEVTGLLCLLVNGDFQGEGTECPPEPK